MDNSINNNLEKTCDTVIEQQKTTTFIEGEASSTATFHNRTSDNLAMQLDNIKDFLGKPYFVNNASWNISSGANTNLLTVDVKTVLLATSYWTSKIQGFNLIRGNAVLRVVLNANPFQAGRLLIRFLPCVNAFQAVDGNWAAFKALTRQQTTQQPHVELDARETVAELSMPFVAPSHYFNIKAGTYDWGTFYVDVLSALNTGASGEATADVSVYLYFTDVELEAPIVPQAKGGAYKKTRLKSVAELEDKKNSMGPVSGSLAVISQTSDSLGHVFPLISSITQPVSWMADLMSQAASIFGWSKPSHNVVASPMAQMTFKHNATCDGIVSSHPLGLTSTNSLKLVDNNSYNDCDEMSFDFLKSVRSFYTSFNWTTSNASTTSLFSSALGPLNFYTNYTTPTHSAHHMVCKIGPAFAYLAPHFQFWRGGFEITLKFVKTQFHTGRVQITWTPDYTSVTSPTLATGLLALREIVDLRYTDEITLCLPFLLEYNYINIAETSGVLDIVVLNELRCPETCSSTIEVLMFANGAKDLEYAGPRVLNPFTGGNKVPYPMYPQAKAMADKPIGDCCEYPLTSGPASESIGEQFRSVKQFLNRSSLLPYGGSPTLYDDGILIWPWFSTYGALNTGSGTYLIPDPSGDIYNWIAPMFAFYRGGVNIHVTTVNAVSTSTTAYTGGAPLNITGSIWMNNTVIGLATSAIQSALDYTSSTLTSIASWPASVGFTSTNAAGLATFEVPYYSRSKCSLVVPSWSNAGLQIPNDISQPPMFANLFWSGCKNSNSNQPKLYRSFRDDFQLSYFLGVPMLAFTYS